MLLPLVPGLCSTLLPQRSRMEQAGQSMSRRRTNSYINTDIPGPESDQTHPHYSKGGWYSNVTGSVPGTGYSSVHLSASALTSL